ncbi:MFS transporter [Halorhabdus rudnickae]|uniref:MFS transporter n=1 Tax=Halorhabdus rudnickae TaxID=1775544 RepID=UPI0014386294|nr:MFS transporter [Halorhabdus rudnickae]
MERIRASRRASWSPSRQTLILASVAGGWFFTFGLRFALPGILPTITASFPDATETQAGIAVTVLWASYGIMQFPAGIAADRIGERRVLVASLVLAALGLFAFSFTPTFSLFVVATGTFGAATGLYGPPRGTLLTRTFPKHADRALGITLALGSIGAAALPAIAAVLVAGLGWRATLGLAIPGFLLASIGVYVAVGAKQTDGGKGANQSAVEQGQDREGPSIASVLVSAGRAITNRQTALAILAAIVMYFGFQGITALLTTYLVTEKGFTQPDAGLLFGLLFLVGALTQWLAGRFADRRRSARVLAAIAFVSVFPLLGLVAFDSRLLVAASTVTIGIRMGFAPVSNAFIIDLLPDDVAGTAWGGVRTALFVVSAFGSTFVGVLAAEDYFDEAILLLALFTAGAAVLYLALPTCCPRTFLADCLDRGS